MIVEPGKIYIRKVRTIHKSGTSSRSQSPLALQTRLTNTLSTAIAHPSNLPAAAIICVRKLQSPPLSSSSSRTTRSPYTWEQAVAVSFLQLVEHAAHPAQSEVPLNAEAVIFADRAEMLACLANDWCKGTASMQWWWKSLFREQELSQTVVLAWLAKPEYIPAALQKLTSMGQAIPFLQSLRDNDVQNMLRGIISCFALHELQPVWRQASSPTDLQDEPPPGRRRASFHLFQAWVSESIDDKLQREQQCLLAIGLTLMRAPAVAHSSAFARDILSWWKAEDDPISADAPSSEHDPNNWAETEPYPCEAEIDTELGGLFYLINLGLFLDLYGDFTTPLQPGIALSIWDFITLLGQELLNRESVGTGLAPLTPTNSQERNGSCWGDGGARDPSLQSPLPCRNLVGGGDRREGSCAPPPYGFEGQETDPVWQLLAQLAGRSPQDMPGQDFVPPDNWRIPPDWLKPFTDEGPWYWAEHNGRLQVWHPAQFLVLDVQLHGADPLEQLASEIGAYSGLEGIEDPINTAESVGTGASPLTPTKAGSRLGEHRREDGGAQDGGAQDPSLQSPLPPDFCMKGVRREGSCAPPSSQHDPFPSHELVGVNGASPVPTDSEPTQGIAHWLHRLMPYIQARLQRALSLTNLHDIADILCKHHAHISVTATHVDIVLSLAGLPIEVRLSGLDRNPGWVPAAGRYITFYFE